MRTCIKETTFDSAHFLPGYNGACANLHGHTYKLQVGVSIEDHVKMENGMIIDFKDLDEMLGQVEKVFDHHYINEMVEMPTAENMVEYIRVKMEAMLARSEKYPGRSVTLIRLWETPTSFTEWVKN